MHGEYKLYSLLYVVKLLHKSMKASPWQWHVKLKLNWCHGGFKQIRWTSKINAVIVIFLQQKYNQYLTSVKESNEGKQASFDYSKYSYISRTRRRTWWFFLSVTRKRWLSRPKNVSTVPPALSNEQALFSHFGDL